MTFDQAGIIGLMSTLLLAFATDRFRIEIVALCGLSAGLLLQLVPAERALSGFSSPAFMTVAEVLIIVQVILRSHMIDWAAARCSHWVTSETRLLLLVCSTGAAVSVFMNNIGALALMLPLTLALCNVAQVRPGRVLIPLSFATLLGGTCSLIGTPANLIVSGARAEAVGTPFALFDMAWAGIPVTIAGVAWLVAVGPRLLRSSGLAASSAEIAGPRRFVTELRIGSSSSFVGMAVDEVEERLAGQVHAIIRDDRHVFGRLREQRIALGDILLVEADVEAALEIGRRRDADVATAAGSGAGEWVEAVVLPGSTVIGSTLRTLHVFEALGVQLVALSSQTHRIEGRLADVAISIGDVMLLRGPGPAVQQALIEVECLALSPRGVAPPEPQGWRVLATFALAVLASALNLATPEIAFGGAILALALTRTVDLRQAIANLNWPVLIMLAAMIPLGEAFQATGAAKLVADGLIEELGASSPLQLTAVALLASVLVTPFVNNVSAAVALAPVAVALAQAAGISPDPLLLAVALGVSLDFLTPFGHHNNTLIMSVGAYRFADFPRVGAPLLAICCCIGLSALRLCWLA